MLSVVLPCHNEIQAIPEMLARLISVRRLFLADGKNLEIIVVDDGSTDGSAFSLCEFPQIRHLRHTECLGYGEALKTGFEAAQGDWIGFLDMDCTYQPEEIFKLLETAQSTNADVVFGCRNFWQSDMPLIRSIGNQFFVFLVRILFRAPLRDPCSGFRIFHTRRKNEVALLAQHGLSFSIQLTVFSLLQKWRLAEVDISYKQRFGVSKLRWWLDGLRFFGVVMHLKWDSLCKRYRLSAQ